jgi:methyl-accepting chemotaxis protein
MLIFIITLVCLLSIALNVLLIWYIKKILEKLLFVSDNIGDLLSSLEKFAKHIDSVHEMEMFYGDTTLQSLIKHSKDVMEEIKSYRQMYEITNEPAETEEEVEYHDEEPG